MKKLYLICLAALTLVCSSQSYAQTSQKLLTKNDIDAKSDFMSWRRKAMETHIDRIQWWQEARFGMFVHWGVYSPYGGDYKGSHAGYGEHIQRVAKIPQEEYRRKFVEKFNPLQFNADRWIKTMKDAGMRYFVITAKHHDGFAMYDSDVSDYNIIKATPFDRDPMRELREACDKYNIRFGFYYSHAFDWGEKDAPGNDWEYENPGGGKKLYEDWYNKYPDVSARIRKNYVDAKAIPQIIELIEKYDPDIIWFDTAHKLPHEELARILKATRKAKPDLVINSRVGFSYDHWGDYKSTADRAVEFYPTSGDWEAIPTTNESYGWSKKDKSHKPASFFIRLLAKAVARGGNILMNVGPMGNGLIDPADLKILKGIGEWMDVNAVSIRGAGRTPLPVQSWGESTCKGDLLFLHVFNWPTNGELILSGLKSDIEMAWLLSDTVKQTLPLKTLDNFDRVISIPAQAPDSINSVIVVRVKGEIETDSQRLLSVLQENRLHAFDGKLVGDGLRFGGGSSRQDYAMGWTNLNQSICWDTRLSHAGNFDVYIEYFSDKKNVNGSFKIQIGSEELIGKIVDTTIGKDKFHRIQKYKIGKVFVSPGYCPVEVKAVDIPGEELMRLRAVHFIPTGD